MDASTELEQAAAELHAAARGFLQAMSRDSGTPVAFLERVGESYDLSVTVAIAPQRLVRVSIRDAHGSTEQTFCRGERTGIVAPSRLR